MVCCMVYYLGWYDILKYGPKYSIVYYSVYGNVQSGVICMVTEWNNDMKVVYISYT